MIRPFPFVSGALALAVLAAGAARAADSDRSPAGDKAEMLEKAYGSTILSTYPDGRQAQLWLQKDGSYKSEGRRGDHSDGTWQVKGDKICMKQRHPFPAPFSYCTPAPADLDHPWKAKAFTGEQITVKLVKGPNGRTVPPSDKPIHAEAKQGDDKG